MWHTPGPPSSLFFDDITIPGRLFPRKGDGEGDSPCLQAYTTTLPLFLVASFKSQDAVYKQRLSFLLPNSIATYRIPPLFFVFWSFCEPDFIDSRCIQAPCFSGNQRVVVIAPVALHRVIRFATHSPKNASYYTCKK